MTTAELEIPVRIELRGGNWRAYSSTDPEILVDGGAGTGKTFAILSRLHKHAQERPGYRGLIVRKVAVDLASTALWTYENEVLYEWDKEAKRSALDGVSYFGGNQHEPDGYRYSNGSEILTTGMNERDRIKGSTFAEIYPNEVTELSIEDYEYLLARLRHPSMIPQQMVSDCNPSYGAHWVMKRCQSGEMRLIHTVLQDNPAYWSNGDWTELGAAYLKRLQSLTGTRRERFLDGKWIGVENAIYDNFDRYKHLVPVRTDLVWNDGALGVDYGDVHPHAVVSVSRASTGRLVVRETWAGRSYDDLVSTVGRFKSAYAITRVRVDPMLKGWEKPADSPLRGRVNRADASPGSRKNRIEYVRRLFDDDALTLDINGEGNADLADEIEMYHYVHRQTDQVDDLVVARVNEDRVAALEYAVEELMANRAAYPTLTTPIRSPASRRSEWQSDRRAN